MGWTNFFMAEVGATAALSGLVIVAISINLSRILSFPELPGRAAEAIVALAGPLVLCSLMLIPQPMFLLGCELLAVSLPIWLLPVMVQWRTRRNADARARANLGRRVLLSQITTLPFPIASLFIALGSQNGFYWLAAGVVLALVNGVVSTWVLLVEILR
jgi:modulator of FtsH protease